MANRISASLFALAATAALATVASGAQPARETIPDYEAVETSVGAVTLPTSAEGSLVVIPCPGCDPKTFRAVAVTRYLLREQPVTLAEFRKATLGRSEAYATVIYDRKTNQLYSISASVDPPVAAPPAAAGRNRQTAR